MPINGLPTLVVHLPISRLAPCAWSNVALPAGQAVNRLRCALNVESSTKRHASTPASEGSAGTTPPPPGTKPTAAATTTTESKPASVAAQAATPDPKPKSRSSRLPALLLLIAPAAAYGTYDLYEENLPEPLKPSAGQAKETIDRWIQDAQSYLNETLEDVMPELRKRLPFMETSPQQGPPVMQNEPVNSFNVTVVEQPATDAPSFQSSDLRGGSDAASVTSLEQQSDALVEVIDVTLLDQLLTEALISDIDSTTTREVISAQVVTTPELEEAVSKLQQAAAELIDAPELNATQVVAAGGVDADHHVHVAHDLLKSVAKELGVQQDLSPSGLVKNAGELHAGAGDDWKSFAAQHRQATADAAAFQDALNQAKEFHIKQVAKLQAQAESAEGRIKHVRKEAEDTANALKEVLKLQQQQAAEETRLAVQRAEQELLAAQAQHVIQERRERLTILDEARSQLNQVAVSAAAQSKQFQTASYAHQRLLALLNLRQALETGNNVNGSVQSLKQACRGDGVAQLALHTLPDSDRLPTSSELIQSLTAMKPHVASLAYMPEGGGGIISTALSYLAASLKFKEGDQVRAGAPVTPDSGLSIAQQLILDGDLTEAANVVERVAKGTAASSLVRPWLTQARQVAAARQTVDFLFAHTSIGLVESPSVAT